MLYVVRYANIEVVFTSEAEAHAHAGVLYELSMGDTVIVYVLEA